MGMKENQTPSALGIQVFELTMDNPEDQDELNRQLHKPGEPIKGSPVLIGCNVQNESAKESVEKKSGGHHTSSRANG